MERLVFAHPAFLWGLLATAVPILVHLFNQRRPRPLAFGAIEFVLRSQRQKARFRLEKTRGTCLGYRFDIFCQNACAGYQDQWCASA